MADEKNGEREAFNAWIRTHEDEVGALDEASAWAGFIGGRASIAESETVCSYAMRMLIAAGHLTQAKAIEALLIAAKVTHPSPPEGMAGWKLVPIEPTPAMLAAVVTTMDDFLLGKEAEKQYREDWAAMLDAAPAAPSTPASVGAKQAPASISHY